MYKVECSIRGVSPLLQHAYSLKPPAEETLKQRSGEEDYRYEWLDTMFATRDGFLYQPASHIEGAMVKVASLFRIKGAHGKTWKDSIRAYCYATPEEIIFHWNGEALRAPGKELLESPTDALSIHIARVKVQRAAVVRSRLMVAPGWVLNFDLEIQDNQLHPDATESILKEAGRAAGLGDFRPKYGRFEIVRFVVDGKQ